jgi:FtsZ-interacting cell division protein YlmF
MVNFLNMSSDDADSDEESENEMESKQLNVSATQKTITSYRFVHRLHGRHSLARMKSDELHRTFFMREYGGFVSLPDVTENVIDDSDDDDVDTGPPPTTDSHVEQEHNLDDIREKTLEHDRQQLKGVHLANAGANNLKIVNHSSVTSSTCTLL